jgi:hypothetical protein
MSETTETLEQAEARRAKEASSWPADNDLAKDFTERRSFERCLAEPEYMAANREWFVRASDEQRRRIITAEVLKNRQAERAALNEQILRDELAATERRTQKVAAKESQRQRELDEHRAQLKRTTRRFE